MMKLYRILILVTIIVLSINTGAQDLQKYRWENRLILVYSEEKDSKELQQQLDELSSDMEGFDDRKLVIYTYSGDSFRKGFEDHQWQRQNVSIEAFFRPAKAFEVLLLGLDGNVKLRQDHLLTREKLYNTIDVMPMRRNELGNRE